MIWWIVGRRWFDFIKAMLIKESALRPEIFQILSASQAKKHTQKKTQDNIRLNSLCNVICIVIHIYIL